MKIRKFLLLLVVTMSIFTFCGCQDKLIPQSVLTQDNYKTGGNLTFVYDEYSHTAFFGGEGEVIQYYSEDITKGWTAEGCRIGVMLAVPKEVDEYKSGSATLNGEKLSPNDYMITLDNQTYYALFQPIVSKDKPEIDLKITWQDGTMEQTYKIIIKEGTIFMDKN